MPSRSAELASVATALGDLAHRVTAIAELYAREARDDLAMELYRVEQALATAQRSLGRILDDRAR